MVWGLEVMAEDSGLQLKVICLMFEKNHYALCIVENRAPRMEERIKKLLYAKTTEYEIIAQPELTLCARSPALSYALLAY